MRVITQSSRYTHWLLDGELDYSGIDSQSSHAQRLMISVSASYLKTTADLSSLRCVCQAPDKPPS